MKIIRSLLFFILFLFSFQAVAVATPLDRIVAVINDDVITFQELEKQTDNAIRQFYSEGKQLPPRKIVEEKILETMIARQLQLQLAKNTGIRTNNTEINTTLKRLAENNSMSLDNFIRQIEKEGISFDDFRRQVKEEMLIAQLRERDVNRYVQITDDEVSRFLISEKEHFFRENEYLVSHVLIKPIASASPEESRKQAKKLSQKLKEGTTVSTLLSEPGIEKNITGGKLEWKKLNNLPRLFSQHVVNMVPGEVSPVIISDRGLHIIKLIDYKQGEKTLSGENIRLKARNMIFRTKVAERGRRWLRQLLDDAYIDNRL